MRIRLIIGLGIIATTLTSCFKDEAPNAECDITKAWVHFVKPDSLFFNESDTLKNVLYSESKILFVVKQDTTLTELAPQFEITPGATISPENGSVHDFSKGPVEYTVTSEDGKWSRKYSVQFGLPEIPLEYDFENASVYTSPAGSVKYYKWFDNCDIGSGKTTEIEVFASANGGFAFSKSSIGIDQYPSVSADGFEGKGLKLTTCSTGFWGIIMQKPLAAGNFFMGEFDVDQALDNTLHSTLMGRPFAKKPLKLNGMYKYKAGEVFWKIVNGKIEEHPEIKDRAAIYAVLYRNHDAKGNPVMLYGDDSKTNPNIVGLAEMEEIPETNSWTPFEITFNYTEDIDPELLEAQGYNLTVVFTSSTDGAYYEGAPGSTLYIDNVKITCE